jgi:hypothetical protein
MALKQVDMQDQDRGWFIDVLLKSRYFGWLQLEWDFSLVISLA